MSTVKRLDFFERYLSLWVLACMVAGVAFGKLAPGLTSAISRWEFGQGSQVNVAIAILIWLMIYPMMLKIDFGGIHGVFARPKGLLVTLFVNWIVKPLSMAILGWVLVQGLFSNVLGWIEPATAANYVVGLIILAAAPCTAMVFVWSYLTDGDGTYTLAQVAINDLIMVFAFAPIVMLLAGVTGVHIPSQVLITSVIVFIVVPLAAGWLSRVALIKAKGVQWLEGTLLPKFRPVAILSLLRDPHADLRLPGGEHPHQLGGRAPPRHPDHHPGLLQQRTHLRAHAHVWRDGTMSPRPERSSEPATSSNSPSPSQSPSSAPPVLPHWQRSWAFWLRYPSCSRSAASAWEAASGISANPHFHETHRIHSLHRQHLPQPHRRGHPPRRRRRSAIDVQSAGSKPAGYVHPKAIEVMKEIGIDISSHHSKHMDEFLDKNVNTVITVCGNADQACPMFPGQVNRYHWGFEDPAHATGSENEITNEFRRIRDQIKLVFEAYAAGLKLSYEAR